VVVDTTFDLRLKVLLQKPKRIKHIKPM